MEDQKISGAVKKPGLKHHIKKNKHLSVWIGLVLVVAIVAGAIIYLNTGTDKIYIEKSEVTADKIDLTPKAPGILEQVYVNAGDQVPADTVVARVGNQLIKTDIAGTIIGVQKDLGAIYNPGQAVVSMIDNSALQVVGALDENKGLKDVSVGQIAMFKVDAFGGKKYFGQVSEISPTSKDSQVTFNISDKRETKQFNIKVKFDTAAYPELKNGMSAKIWIYKN